MKRYGSSCGIFHFQERKIIKVWSTYQNEPILSSVDSLSPFTLPRYINNYRPDIVVIKLRESFELNKFVMPVCLPKKKLKTGSKCFASGWGNIIPYSPLEQQSV